MLENFRLFLQQAILAPLSWAGFSLAVIYFAVAILSFTPCFFIMYKLMLADDEQIKESIGIGTMLIVIASAITALIIIFTINSWIAYNM